MKIWIITRHFYPEIEEPFNVITTTASELLKAKNFKIKIMLKYDDKKNCSNKLFEIIKNFDVIHQFL